MGFRGLYLAGRGWHRYPLSLQRAQEPPPAGRDRCQCQDPIIV